MSVRHTQISGRRVMVVWVVSGGGTVPATGVRDGTFKLPGESADTLTLKKVSLTGGEASGSTTIDIWIGIEGNGLPTNADSICAGVEPSISAATESNDTTLTGYITNFAGGSLGRINVDAASTFTWVAAMLEFEFDKR